MDVSWLEWIGYLASFLILTSLLMSSILKLRWISLAGSIMYAIYGFIIGSWPVTITNIATSFINIYYLVKIYKSYKTKEFFRILEVDNNSSYLDYFLDYYEEGIKKSVSDYDFIKRENPIGFYVLRNMVPASLFLGSRYDDNTLLIDLDFAIPEYRDFKIGEYIFNEQKDYFLKRGFTRIISYPHSENFSYYLVKMGFEESKEKGNKIYVKNITSNN